ncbi:helix-turn-helix domain-containing protein [Rubrobacter tropicus]|uniref:helix-turn-helix domain-containing protein n=1 Tax=Rubrobacter tropicus TaxID=2653851 RepID=UPI00140944B9|nr:helix-turn-helix domain-containing protein [Rubrobacter tropicus]
MSSEEPKACEPSSRSTRRVGARRPAGYLRAHKSTVHRALKRWAEEGPEGLEDRRPARPPGVRKVTLRVMEAVRRLQQNPDLGEFRVHAALAQIGIQLSPKTCGRILALNRELYDLEKPKGPAKEKKEMPFVARLAPNAGPRLLPQRALRRGGALRLARGAGDRRRRYLPAGAVRIHEAWG